MRESKKYFTFLSHFLFCLFVVSLEMGLSLAKGRSPKHRPEEVDVSSKSEDKGGVTSVRLRRVEAKYVCMGMKNNHVFERELIPVQHKGKTYFGCCQGCVQRLMKEPALRRAIDPVSGKEVDKATALIGALPDGTVRYFENEENMTIFEANLLKKE